MHSPMDRDREGAGFNVVFESLGDAEGLEVVDPIERRRRSLHTPAPVSPTAADSDAFPFPVEAAVAIETAAISLPTAEQVLVRDADGGTIAEVDHGDTASFPADSYVLEPTGIVRTFLRVESAVTVAPAGHGTRITFGDGNGDGSEPDLSAAGDGTRVAVGSRSPHQRPAATVTTTADPADVLQAISTFGSALKTTSPERAFGSFRGHPPAIEVGDELSIPDGLEPPAETVHLEVPAEYRYAFAVAPLAYYLGAPVREGPEPRIVGSDAESSVGDGGLDHRLDRDGSVEAGVERALKRIFFLECVARTEGIYEIDLHERRRLEERVDLPLAELYSAPQNERLQAFLDVPHELVSDLLPDWPTAAHVEPTAEAVETLPYLVDDLALVDVSDAEHISPTVVESGGVQGLLRGGESPDRTSTRPADVTKTANRGTSTGRPTVPRPLPSAGALRRGSAAADTTFVQPTASTAAREETWVGEGTPVGATKAVPAAYRNRIGRSPTTGDVEVAVVCNADAMAAEGDLVDDVYGSRANLPFDVTVHRDLTTAELAAVLAEDRDFLHYVGHIEAAGFECADGLLDAAELDSVGADAFFLNACQSYDQGMALIEGGAIGGIVTIRDVVNHGAVRIGRAVARLLNYGFPLRPALEIAREESVVGALYIVVGDGGLSIAQTPGGTPMLVRVQERGERYAVEIDMFGADTGVGGITIPHLDAVEHYYLASGSTERIELAREELVEFLQFDDGPLVLDGQLAWADEIDRFSL